MELPDDLRGFVPVWVVDVDGESCTRIGMTNSFDCQVVHLRYTGLRDIAFSVNHEVGKLIDRLYLNVHVPNLITIFNNKFSVLQLIKLPMTKNNKVISIDGEWPHLTQEEADKIRGLEAARRPVIPREEISYEKVIAALMNMLCETKVRLDASDLRMADELIRTSELEIISTLDPPSATIEMRKKS
jgi:hypothetical protein